MTTFLLALSFLAGVPQEALEVQVGIRPGAIRVDQVAVMTVRVVSTGNRVDGIDFIPEGGVEVQDVRERRSTHVTPDGLTGQVVETDFHLLGVNPGRYQLPPVLVYVNGRPVEAESPVLEISAAPLQWGTARSRAREQAQETRAPPDRGEARVRPQGVPPQEGELQSVVPGHPGWEGVLYPDSALPGAGAAWFSFPGQYPQAVPSYPWPNQPPGTFLPGMQPYPGGGMPGYPGYGSPFSGYPMTMPGYSMGGAPYAGPGWPGGGGGKWAATARSDPWWPEMVPELLDYQTVARDAEGWVSLSAGLTPEAVYAGQQVTHVATASFAPGAHLRLGGDPEYLPPHPEGFWIVDLPQVGTGTPVAAQGQVDQAYTFRRALFPLQEGQYLVPPARVSPAGSVTDTSTLAATEPLPVTVLPVPWGRAPAGFTGAVGRYRMEAYLRPEEVAVGETAVLTVRIIGVGNVQGLPSPELALFADVEVAPLSDWALPEVVDGVVGGVKTFNWMVVPVAPGTIRLGPVLYPYFDPYLGSFGVAESGELELRATVLPGGGG